MHLKTICVGAIVCATLNATLAQPAPAAVGAAVSKGPTTPTYVNWKLTPADITRNCGAEIGKARRRINAVLALPTSFATVKNTLLPLEDASADLSDNLAAEGMLGALSSDAAVRQASDACNDAVSTFTTQMSARSDLYRALASVQKSRTAKTDADRRLLYFWLLGSTRSGASLTAEKKAKYIALQAHLDQLGTQFSENIATDGSTITITKAQAVGLPEDLLANAKATTDGYQFAVNESTSALFMPNEKDEAARKAFYLLYSNRAAAKNVAILSDALKTRYQIAQLLGYKTWADYVLAARMAKSPSRVTAFLQNLDTQLLPKAREDAAALAALKASDTKIPGAKLERWDMAYYDNMLRKTKYAVDNEAIRRYFPAEHTISAVLGIYSRVLGVKYTRIVDPPGPYPEDLGYAVNDAATGRFIGTFYLDLYPRPGKFTHFANFPFLGARRMSNGTMRPPVSMIIGNWPQPAPGKPSLLSHGDVQTFFHEFGHCMAALLTTAPYETLGGFTQDFVEAPSQMLENWVWDPAILKQLSQNVDTQQPLPDDLISKMIAARYVNNALFTTSQILYATVDMRYHTSDGDIDTTAVWDTVAQQTTPLAVTPGVHPQAAFGHLFGYDAAYYGYLWSKVYAQDLFTAFKAGGLESPVVGRRYRDDILAPAQTYEPDVLVKRFLGRPMSPNAFYAEFGISPPE